MNKVADLIIRRKTIIVAVFAIAAALCTLLAFTVNVNRNLLDYLPADSESTIALDIMDREFDGAVPNASVMISGVSIPQALECKRQIAGIEGVQSVIWLDDVIDVTAPLEVADTGVVEQYYKDGAALFSVAISSGFERTAVAEIYAYIGSENAMSGDAVDTYYTGQSETSETRSAMLALVPAILVILLLTTSSWAEPILYLAAMGVAILINMGLNAFLNDVSSITNIVTPILQLAVSLDYAIFLLHSFQEHLETTSDIKQAMRLAMRSSFSSIAASAATTLFGFLALAFMKFRIGPDMGFNLAKAIVLSYISVMVFLPALTLCCYRLIDKSRHKKLIRDSERIGSVLLKIRIPALVLALLLVVPCFLAQGRTSYIYGSINDDLSSKSGSDAALIEEAFGASNPMVILVPKGDPAKEETLCGELSGHKHVTSIISYVTSVGASIPQDYLGEEIISEFYSENYARIIVYTDTEAEGDEAFQTVEDIRAVVSQYYDESYSCGTSANLYDMKTVVSKDNTVVNLIAVAAIAAVLFITFRSAILPFLLLFVIETAIWINLSIPYFAGQSLCYIGYLVISTVQLGATIDYAILLTNSYMRNRTGLLKKDAVKKTLGANFISVLTSALILACAGIGLNMTSSNYIVTALGALLARGTLLSFVMVMCVLPALLLLFDKIIEKTTYNVHFRHGERKGATLNEK